ncbi:PREDICTED: regulator of G-protein signaling 9-binding protein-like [Ficedula albicollis]|uniref:regulator of G-protein signaling 9-binding protein-like n=1 Tax=Ficedula albicollis TaxID=59894 RepID=UPI0007AD84CF|nr:PREDICTED: regulator of G-protein signaling 9-binding protein-like [Ficedula albicollis]
MAPDRRDACRGRGAVGACATAQAALCKATAGHRQLVLQLGGSADSPRLRDERRRRSAEARELSMGKEGAAGPGSSPGEPLQPHWGQGGAQHACPAGLRRVLLAGLRRSPASARERQELERLWVLFLSGLELFLQDLCRAQHLCQLFSMQGGDIAPLHTGLRGWGLPSRRGGGPTQPPTTQCLEEEIEHVRVTLAEMESGANIPPWTVEATETTQPSETSGTTEIAAWGGPCAGLCCGVL